jgi:hypothetical protein
VKYVIAARRNLLFEASSKVVIDQKNAATLPKKYFKLFVEECHVFHVFLAGAVFHVHAHVMHIRMGYDASVPFGLILSLGMGLLESHMYHVKIRKITVFHMDTCLPVHKND